MTISLNDTEQKLVKYVSKKRFEYCRQVGANATVYGGRNPMDAEIAQYGAEVAFCKYMNIYPDTSYDRFNPEDCFTYDGHRIDVKYTSLRTGRLLAKDKGWDNHPDYFALMIGDFPNYYFAGFMKASELLVESRLDTSLPHPAYAASQNELTKRL